RLLRIQESAYDSKERHCHKKRRSENDEQQQRSSRCKQRPGGVPASLTGFIGMPAIDQQRRDGNAIGNSGEQGNGQVRERSSPAPRRSRNVRPRAAIQLDTANRSDRKSFQFLAIQREFLP